MFPRERRVTSKIFHKILKGRRFNVAHVSLSLSSLLSSEQNRFSFVVSKKVSKSAVKRNLLRRRSTAVVEKLIHFIPSGIAGIFFLKPGAELLSSHALSEEINDLLWKAGLISK